MEQIFHGTVHCEAYKSIEKLLHDFKIRKMNLPLEVSPRIVSTIRMPFWDCQLNANKYLNLRCYRSYVSHPASFDFTLRGYDFDPMIWFQVSGLSRQERLPALGGSIIACGFRCRCSSKNIPSRIARCENEGKNKSQK